MDTTQVLAALRDFFEATPGFETANYSTYADYRRDYREALRDLHECRKLYKRLTDPELTSASLITLEDIHEASRAFSGRLQFSEPVEGSEAFATPSDYWHYTPGQYYPIEYRAACATVLRALSNIVSAKWEAQNPRCSECRDYIVTPVNGSFCSSDCSTTHYEKN